MPTMLSAGLQGSLTVHVASSSAASSTWLLVWCLSEDVGHHQYYMSLGKRTPAQRRESKRERLLRVLRREPLAWIHRRNSPSMPAFK